MSATTFRFNFGSDASTTFEVIADDLEASADCRKCVVYDTLLVNRRDFANTDWTRQTNESDVCRRRGVYEGGLDCWDAADDLVGFLEQHVFVDGGAYAVDNVLELGCGHAEPGKAVIQWKLDRGIGGCVDLQDYDEEVVEKLRNELSSGTESERTDSVQTSLIHGDWSNMHDVIEKGKYDLIITSETCYDATMLDKLHDCLDFTLSRRKGSRVVLAGKADYVGAGCGGGTRLFVDLIRKKGVFVAKEVVEVNSDQGSYVSKEIVVLERR